jgi:hypothetical protein
MARHGIRRELHESPRAFIERLSAKSSGSHTMLGARLEEQLYDPNQVSSSVEMRWLRQELRKLRFRLAFSPQGKAF